MNAKYFAVGLIVIALGLFIVGFGALAAIQGDALFAAEASPQPTANVEIEQVAASLWRIIDYDWGIVCYAFGPPPASAPSSSVGRAIACNDELTTGTR